ncbi:hypothetical protein AKJ61_02040 [candidate division MSBL1 archaeon SCGC-AAA259B11]|uniref:NADH dehydrogenase n=1 Tax=candidate division MSBL1 archaeon SCGC-AAA259B11 TaxID=1698260 RepID=A0A133U6P1_9EURY|nr:hypothetical protein AKJ61_02040 [candidate division MSBL1 archaeon SCGC-AAA259B11]
MNMLNYFLFLALAATIFGIGIYGLLSRRNILRMLLSAEVMFSSAILTLITLAATSDPSGGRVIALIAIGTATAEVGVLISIAILFFRTTGETDVFELSERRKEGQ